MLKFIVDTQLPPRLAYFLKEKGLDAIHTTFYPDGHLLKDHEIVSIAIKETRIVVTKDQDFFDNYLIKGSPPKVLLLQFGNVRNQELIQLFDLNIDRIIDQFSADAELLLFSRDQIVEY